MSKELTLEPIDGSGQLFKVVWRGGAGRVPEELLGNWTKNMGLRAIEAYKGKAK
jgi:hypothetical protein